MCVLALVGSFMVVKAVSKVSGDNSLNHIGRTCCCRINDNVSGVSNTYSIVLSNSMHG